MNGLFYACLAIIAGSAIIAIGGGGIAPMRMRWEKALGHLEREAQQFQSRVQIPGATIGEPKAGQPMPPAGLPHNESSLSV